MRRPRLHLFDSSTYTHATAVTINLLNPDGSSPGPTVFGAIYWFGRPNGDGQPILDASQTKTGKLRDITPYTMTPPSAGMYTIVVTAHDNREKPRRRKLRTLHVRRLTIKVV